MWVERAGIPATAVICTGFVQTAHKISAMYGLKGLRVAEYPPPNICVQKPQEVYERAKVLLDDIIKLLSQPVSIPKKTALTKPSRAKDREPIFKGTLTEVNDFFYMRRWTDGLPIIPPTLEAVKKMLKYTTHSPEETLGILQPPHGLATVWRIAVNGVIAGCRPEYMPVMESIVQTIAEPRYGIHHAGSTAGWTPIIILNGPIIKDLDLNSGQGVLRPERQANITIARFLRLVMVNIDRNFLATQLGDQGLTTSKEIKLPSNWGELMKKTSK